MEVQVFHAVAVEQVLVSNHFQRRPLLLLLPLIERLSHPAGAVASDPATGVLDCGRLCFFDRGKLTAALVGGLGLSE